MQNNPRGNRAVVRIHNCSIVPITPALLQSLFDEKGQTPQPEAHQLSLLALLKKSQEPAIRIELIPIHLTVGTDERFWIIHQESGLQVPGQFSRCEAEYILAATKEWNWAVDLKTREPACRLKPLRLLERICFHQVAQGVAA